MFCASLPVAQGGTIVCKLRMRRLFHRLPGDRRYIGALPRN